jgi:uncharacterized membrane protein YbhN (UPF0104 family)
VSRALFALKLVLAAATLYGLTLLVEWTVLLKTARGADLWFIGAAILLLPANIGLEAYRWGRLVRRIAPATSHSKILGAVLSGYPLGLLTPARMGDYAGRSLYLRELGAWRLAALTFAERMATLACCLLVGLPALGYYLAGQPSLHTPAWLGVGLGALIGLGLLLLLLSHPRATGRFISAVIPERYKKSLRMLEEYSSRDASALLYFSLLRYCVFSLQFWLLVRAFDPGLSLTTGLIAVALVFFAKSAVPGFTLGDLGIREGMAVYFFGALGLVEAAALNGALCVFAINLLLPSVVGLPLMLRYRIAPGEKEREVALPAYQRVKH